MRFKIWELSIVNESNVQVVVGILLWIASNQFFRSRFAAAAQWVEINSGVELLYSYSYKITFSWNIQFTDACFIQT
jgi:hypothetical protein